MRGYSDDFRLSYSISASNFVLSSRGVASMRQAHARGTAPPGGGANRDPSHQARRLASRAAGSGWQESEPALSLVLYIGKQVT
jgi:hypothetical protein